MGLPKATLPFGDEFMLQRVVRILNRVVSPIVIVAAGSQMLPELPTDILVARDRREERGPLEGILAGLSAIAPHVDAAYITSCDVPLLEPSFVRRLVELLAGYEIVVPYDEQFPHPLAAVYRTALVDRIERLLSENRLRPAFLFESANTLRVSVKDLREVDPQLLTLRNLNHPQDYFAALSTAGLPIDSTVRAQLTSQ